MTTARGRHAPPPEVRLPLQRERLLRAAAREFAERGYAGASSESISRRAGMSKATFYEHFANKEECMLALFDMGAELVQTAMADAAANAPTGDARERLRAGTRAFLGALAEHPEFAQTLLVEIIGAGPRAAQRRDQILQAFADVLDAENAAAARRGLMRRFRSPEDSFAVIGAITELVSRQVRLGAPDHVLDLAPVIDRLIFGLLGADPGDDETS
ncbi:MAG TPA: TetR/AcrR family transcriptional regulator [Solirubrobacteraceae bacterium]|nr:TetR/AcrR family transcriptional regulator [Solirubrobacteraceae bacterium]